MTEPGSPILLRAQRPHRLFRDDDLVQVEVVILLGRPHPTQIRDHDPVGREDAIGDLRAPKASVDHLVFREILCEGLPTQ